MLSIFILTLFEVGKYDGDLIFSIEYLFNKGLFKKGHYMMFMDLLKYKGE